MLTRNILLPTTCLTLLTFGCCFEISSSMPLIDLTEFDYEEIYEFPMGDESEYVEEMVTLLCKDGKSEELPLFLAKISETLSLFIDDRGKNPIIPLPDIPSSTMKKVIACMEQFYLLPKAEFEGLKEHSMTLRDVLKRGELVQALYYLRLPIVVFIVGDGPQEALPLHIALESSTLRPLINEDQLHKALMIMPTRKQITPQNNDKSPRDDAQSASKSIHAHDTASAGSPLAPSYTALGELLDALRILSQAEQAL